ncbi:PREDICTED: PRUPE_4G249200 [Prunus dulcis]|uniref:PREDICTED: PRUPE_4G249200 n=1 Tax=Prunus dulcis TaxID=3755 RepID=A0A5E4FZZ2_PRUDU|nr:PREDICTED: PRUPE_4G249200 [Prunus dulcis]
MCRCLYLLCQKFSPDIVSYNAAARLSAFSSVQVRQGGGPKPHAVAPKWTKPQPGWVEAIASREGAVMAVERGFTNYVIKSYSLHIVTALRTTTTDRSVIGPIVEDTKSLLAPITGEVTTHIRCTANTVVDRLARFGRNIGADLT